MELINKFLIVSLSLGLLTFASCSKGDDDGPAEPEYQGKFTGTFTDLTVAAGTSSDFVATSITATHDTTAFGNQPAVKIDVVNSAGVKITLQLKDTTAQLTPYVLNGSSTSKSTIILGTNNGPFTTVSDDIPPINQGSVTITDGGMNDGILRGTINYIVWVEVISNGEDVPRAVLENGSFEVPLTRKGFTTTPPEEASFSADIDGEAFDVLLTSHSETSITAMSTVGGKIIKIYFPANATVGEHDIELTSGDYDVVYTDGTAVYTSTGTVTMTSFDYAAGNASGTFEAVAIPSNGGAAVEVTNGTFSF